MRKLDSILKSRDINHSAHKGPYSQSYGFSSSHVWMWELDHNRRLRGEELIAFELWCWRRLLRVSRTARRSNQSILKEINSEFSLEGLILKLKLQYSGYLMWRADSLEKTLMLAKTECRGERGDSGEMVLRMVSLTQCTWVWANSRRQWRAGKPGLLESMWLQRA